MKTVVYDTPVDPLTHRGDGCTNSSKWRRNLEISFEYYSHFRISCAVDVRTTLKSVDETTYIIFYLYYKIQIIIKMNIYLYLVFLFLMFFYTPQSREKTSDLHLLYNSQPDPTATRNYVTW